MNKITSLSIAVTIAIFSASFNAATAASKIQNNHQDHHKMAGMSKASGKKRVVKKATRTAPKRATSLKKKTPAASKGGMNMSKTSTQKAAGNDMHKMMNVPMMGDENGMMEMGKGKMDKPMMDKGMDMMKKGMDMKDKKKPVKKDPGEMKPMKMPDMDDLDMK